jgi:hypothetical protein
MYLLRASMGLIGLDDHRGQGWSHKAGDILNIIYLPIGIGLMSLVYIKIKSHLALANEKYAITEYLSSATYQEFIKKFDTTDDKAALLDSFYNYYEILTYNAFPIDINLFYNTAFTVVIPISMWFLVNNYQDKIND